MNFVETRILLFGVYVGVILCIEETIVCFYQGFETKPDITGDNQISGSVLDLTENTSG